MVWIIILIKPRTAALWLLLLAAGGLAVGDHLLDRPTGPFVDYLTIADEAGPVGVKDVSRLGWPTGRYDVPPAQTPSFAAVLLSADVAWRSCEGRTCLTGTDGSVLVHYLARRNVEVTELSAFESHPFTALVELGISREHAARLLTP